MDMEKAIVRFLRLSQLQGLAAPVLSQICGAQFLSRSPILAANVKVADFQDNRIYGILLR
jgi:hypothetical protein